MTANHYVLTLNGTTQRLSSGLLAGQAADATKGLLFLSLQALSSVTAPIYLGAWGPTLSSGNYGWRLERPVNGIPSAPSILETVATTLASLAVLGRNASTEQLAVFYITK